MSDPIRDALPCPFCGKTPSLREMFEHYQAEGGNPAGSYSEWVFVGCDDCGIEMGDEYQSNALALWNRRAALTTPSQQDQVAPEHPKTKLKEHQIEQTINALTAVGLEFGQTPQLRSRIAHIIGPILKGKGFPRSVVNAYAMPVMTKRRLSVPVVPTGESWCMCNDCGTWKQMQDGNHHPWCHCGSDNFRWEDERDRHPEGTPGVPDTSGGNTNG